MRISTLLLLTSAFAIPEASAYYGRHSTEAQLLFEATADVVLAGSPTVAMLNGQGGAHDAALARVDEQIQHLMGTFQSESFKSKFPFPGVLGEYHQIRFMKIEDGSAEGRKLLTYRYSGKVVFKKEAFRANDVRMVPINLPLAPDLIYALGVKGDKNLCTDEHYNSEGDFWYFWDPDMDGCPLSGDTRNIVRITGKLTRLENTKLTYPDYEKLYGNNGNGANFDIAVFFGYIDEVENLRMHNRRDDGAKAMRFLEAELKNQGFELVEKKNAFREYRNGRVVEGINYLRRYQRHVSKFGHDVTVRVQILLGDTMIGSKDETFHRYLMPAFRDADVVVYDGHSGLGGNLDLGSLPDIEFRADKYQLFFFNGCSSYPYFNGSFFKAKGGSENLQIVTSGLPTITDSAGPNAVTFIQGFLDGKTLSFQTMLSRLEVSNGDNGTYLTGVNGDESSSWHP
ncbi:MAG: hypothetical protein HY074_20540 [Deltaproteobacteria bacterium]|nr:hypothetical protein [Deltaproteobacteria bacterium]